MSETWIGRQPIFDTKLATHAYELLFRSPRVGHTVAGTMATAQVIVGALADVGLDRVVGDAQAFVNITRGYVVGQYPLPLPTDRVVLELLEDIEVDREVVMGVERLKEHGFKIALDDVVEVRPALYPLLRRADLVKVECLGRTKDQLRAIVDALAQFDVEILAEKLETQDELDFCRELGFDYFQGYFLERPSIIKSTALMPQRVQLLRIVAELQSSGVTFEQVEEIVRVDVALSFKLLACVNAASFGLARRIDTVRDALVYLGVAKVRNIVTLLLLARLDDKPTELVALAMTRAKMCENVASARGRPDARAAFTIGMFSLLDALLDQKMEKVLEALPLGLESKQALLGGSGELGELLTAVVAYEHGDWSVAEAHLGADAPMQTAFLDAVSWVDGVMRQLAAS